MLGYNLMSVVRLWQVSVNTRLIKEENTLGGIRSVRIGQVSVYYRCPYEQVGLYDKNNNMNYVVKPQQFHRNIFSH